MQELLQKILLHSIAVCVHAWIFNARILQTPSKNTARIFLYLLAKRARKWPNYVQDSKFLARHARLFARKCISLHRYHQQDLASSCKTFLHGYASQQISWPAFKTSYISSPDVGRAADGSWNPLSAYCSMLAGQSALDIHLYAE